VSQGRVGHLRIGVSVAISEQFLSVAFATLLKDAPRTKLIVSVFGQRLDGSGFNAMANWI